MKNLIQKMAITWIALLGIVGIYKERAGKSEEKDSNRQQQEVVLDEYELASFHNN